MLLATMLIVILFNYDANVEGFTEAQIYEDHEVAEAISKFLAEYPNERYFQVRINRKDQAGEL